MLFTKERGSKLERERWQRWPRRREELVAEKQWQERKQKGKRKVAREKAEHIGRVARLDTLQPGARKEATTILYAIDEDDSENIEESSDNEEYLQAWCLREESENEQW